MTWAISWGRCSLIGLLVVVCVVVVLVLLLISFPEEEMERGCVPVHLFFVVFVLCIIAPSDHRFPLPMKWNWLEDVNASGGNIFNFTPPSVFIIWKDHFSAQAQGMGRPCWRERCAHVPYWGAPQCRNSRHARHSDFAHERRCPNSAFRLD